MKTITRNHRKSGGPARPGFSLLEVVVGIALVAIAVLGLAQMFTLGILNNLKSERIANASFLAQQQVDIIRNLSSDELTTLSSANGIDLTGDGHLDILKDEAIDINTDGRSDYRRITEIAVDSSGAGTMFEVSVLVFSAERLGTQRSQLLSEPIQYGVKSKVNTVISR